MYSCETWKLTKSLENKLRGTQQRSIDKKAMLRLTLINKESNMDKRADKGKIYN